MLVDTTFVVCLRTPDRVFVQPLLKFHCLPSNGDEVRSPFAFPYADGFAVIVGDRRGAFTEPEWGRYLEQNRVSGSVHDGRIVGTVGEEGKVHVHRG